MSQEVEEVDLTMKLDSPQVKGAFIPVNGIKYSIYIYIYIYFNIYINIDYRSKVLEYIFY